MFPLSIPGGLDSEGVARRLAVFGDSGFLRTFHSLHTSKYRLVRFCLIIGLSVGGCILLVHNATVP